MCWSLEHSLEINIRFLTLYFPTTFACRLSMATVSHSNTPPYQFSAEYDNQLVLTLVIPIQLILTLWRHSTLYTCGWAVTKQSKYTSVASLIVLGSSDEPSLTFVSGTSVKWMHEMSFGFSFIHNNSSCSVATVATVATVSYWFYCISWNFPFWNPSIQILCINFCHLIMRAFLQRFYLIS